MISAEEAYKITENYSTESAMQPFLCEIDNEIQLNAKRGYTRIEYTLQCSKVEIDYIETLLKTLGYIIWRIDASDRRFSTFSISWNQV